MRNLKKVIALVAVFAMLVSTVAFATTFSDVKDDDNYAEAIEMLSNLGILTGDDQDGDGGVIAAYTTLPVIALPIKSSLMDGLDSLLSMVQMPSGIPVATVAVNGADNAGILAVQMLALSDKSLSDKLKQFKADMAKAVEEKDKALQEELGLIKKA